MGSKRFSKRGSKFGYSKRSRFGQRRGYASAYPSRMRSLVPYSAASVPEVKGSDGLPAGVEYTLTAISGTGSMTPVNLISAGTSINNRVSRRVRMTSLEVDGWFVPIATTASARNPTFMRFVVVYDRQSNGTLPQLNAVFQDIQASSTMPTTITVATSHFNLNNRDRFIVLLDERFLLPALQGATGFTSTAPAAIPVHDLRNYIVQRHIKLHGLSSHYQADSGTAVYGDVANGTIFAAIFDSASTVEDATSQSNFQFVGSFRVKFVDC